MGSPKSDILKLSLLLATCQFTSSSFYSTTLLGALNFPQATSRSFIISAPEGGLMIIMADSIMLFFPYL